ncbi:hypothetical protein PAPYR_11789 [Paratrimastix pyriformis]|uniref:Uncharacterized protein n=1 Tax=Paratrimastix pyriformis TaxID=342808 RepID=A0ABQ8U5H6_9EUKA|nr:hypothetical protein PAPYR_11789 [Paratrimastix pyriformis]
MVFTPLFEVVLRECINTIVAEPRTTLFERSVFGLNNEIFVGLIITLRHRTAHCTAKFILRCSSSDRRQCRSSQGRALAPWAQDAIPHVCVSSHHRHAQLLASPAPIVVIPPAGNDIKITMPQTPTTTIDVCEDPPQVDRLELIGWVGLGLDGCRSVSRSGLPSGATRTGRLRPVRHPPRPDLPPRDARTPADHPPAPAGHAGAPYADPHAALAQAARLMALGLTMAARRLVEKKAAPEANPRCSDEAIQTLAGRVGEQQANQMRDSLPGTERARADCQAAIAFCARVRAAAEFRDQPAQVRTP